MSKFILALIAFVLASCGSEYLAACGQGTVYRGRECVPEAPVITCGDGTRTIGNVCLPAATLGDCGTGTVLTLSGGRPVCVPEPATPTTQIVCGPGTHQVGNVCLVDVTQPATPITCGAGTQRVGSECRPTAAPARAKVHCWFASVPNVAFVVVTPSSYQFGKFTCISDGNDADLELVRLKREALLVEGGWDLGVNIVRVAYLQSHPNDGYLASSGGPDAEGYLNMRFSSPYRLLAGQAVEWYFVVHFSETQYTHVRYQFRHQSADSTIEARDVTDGRPAEIDSSYIESQSMPVIATLTYPSVFAAADAPTSGVVTPTSATVAARLGVANNHPYRPLNFQSVWVCIDQIAGNTREYTVRMRAQESNTVIGEYHGFRSSAGWGGACIRMTSSITVPAGQSKRLQFEIDFTGALPNFGDKIQVNVVANLVEWSDAAGWYRQVYGLSYEPISFGVLSFN